MKAVANAKGYFGTRLVKPGETFEVPEGTKKGKWFDIAVEPPKPAKADDLS